MKKLLPKTKYGKLSLILIVIMPVLFASANLFLNFYIGVPAGNSILEDIILRPGIAISMLLGIISGIAAFFTGAFSIYKQKERNILVLIATFIGLLLFLFVIGEFIQPYH